MPELPDLTVYQDALASRLVGQVIEGITVVSPFVVRTVDPPISAAHGRRVMGQRLLGKRLVLVLDDDLFLVIHLMLAGRLQWRDELPKLNRRLMQALIRSAAGTLILTEAGTTRRASLHLVRGEPALAALDRGGIDPLHSSRPLFAERLRRENRTVKRALTDPRLFSGIGNAYSDEILHAARLSPLRLTRQMTDDEVARLHEAVMATLTLWIERLRAETGDAWPTKVTAFRDDMSVHGRFGQPCPVCGAPVQRIRYAEHETNYCARCQTGGRRLADRALSRLLGEDYPREIEGD